MIDHTRDRQYILAHSPCLLIQLENQSSTNSHTISVRKLLPYLPPADPGIMSVQAYGNSVEKMVSIEGLQFAGRYRLRY